MKNKVQSIVLLVMTVVLCILLIPSFGLGNVEKLIETGMPYENLIGDIVAYLAKKNHAGETTYGELLKQMSMMQVIGIVVQLAICILSFVFAQKNKKIPLSELIIILLSICQINIQGSSNAFTLLSLIPVVLAVTYLIARRIELNKARRSEKQNQ